MKNEYLITLPNDTELLVVAKHEILEAESRDIPREIKLEIVNIWTQIDSESVEYFPTDKEIDFIEGEIIERIENDSY